MLGSSFPREREGAEPAAPGLVPPPFAAGKGCAGLLQDFECRKIWVVGGRWRNLLEGEGGCCLAGNTRQQILAVLVWERNSSHICLHEKLKQREPF